MERHAVLVSLQVSHDRSTEVFKGLPVVTYDSSPFDRQRQPET